jgi:circadian clock protein KaiB
MAKPRSRSHASALPGKPKNDWGRAAPKKNGRVAGSGNRDENSVREYEKAIADAATHKDRYVLRLYVTGSTPRSLTAIANIRKLCDEYLKGRYDLEVVDIYQQPILAQGEQIIAAPTLIKKLPAPLRKMVGDFSNETRVLVGLDIQSHPPTS